MRISVAFITLALISLTYGVPLDFGNPIYCHFYVVKLNFFFPVDQKRAIVDIVERSEPGGLWPPFFP